jgi:hypothetical protein
MASAMPLPADEPSGQGKDINGDTTMACHVEPSKQAEQYDQTIKSSSPACESTVPEASRNHDSSTGDDLKGLDYYPVKSGQTTYVDQEQDQGQHHVRKESGHCKASLKSRYGQWLVWLFMLVAYAYMSALAQGWAQVLAMAPYAGTGALSGNRVWVLAMFAVIACVDARPLPPNYTAQNGRGSDPAASSNKMENASAQNSEPGPNIHGTSWVPWVTLAIIIIGVAGGAEAWVYFNSGRSRQIRAMVYVGVFTLVIAMVPMIFHQVGGIEAELNGPLWALWAGAHVNFVLRGALLLRNDQAGYLSPLGYVAVLAVLSHLVFSIADKPNSRLYTTITTLVVTVLQDVGLRAFSGEL